MVSLSCFVFCRIPVNSVVFQVGEASAERRNTGELDFEEKGVISRLPEIEQAPQSRQSGGVVESYGFDSHQEWWAGTKLCLCY